MATFLQLCQEMSREVNAGGTLATVVAQTGLFQKIVEFVRRADYNIQTSYINWDFLQKEWSFSLVAGLENYNPPSDLAAYDESSFWSGAGTNDAQPILNVSYKEWRDGYRHNPDSGDCYVVSIKPDKSIVFAPPPVSAVAITVDYFKQPVKMTTDLQESDVPVSFHNVIKALSKVYFAENRHDNGWYQSALIEYNDLLRKLKANALPGWYDENKSESSLPSAIMVM